jgi:tryptophan-rich sensory protein
VWAVLYALMFAAIWLWWARRLNVGSLQLHIAWWLAANLLFNYAWVPVFGAYLSNPDMGAWPAMLVIVMATGSAWVVWALWLTDRSWLSLALWTPYAVWLVFATGLQAQYLFPEREYRAVRRV